MLYTRQQIANARKVMRSFGCSSLLSDPSSNPKIEKNGKLLNVLTAPLHLAPHKKSGRNVCPWASAGCIAACLDTAGNAAFLAKKQKARIARTKFFFKFRREFFIVLCADIAKLQRKADKLNMLTGVRPNATSDIPWESFKLPDTNTNLFEAFPDVQFYDYTKSVQRMMKFLNGEMPNNYHLTFSTSESNWSDCERVLKAGGTVSTVFNVKRGQPMIEEYYGFPVIDADTHDYRPNDPPGHIAGLRAKGKAIYDESGFVKMVAYNG